MIKTAPHRTLSPQMWCIKKNKRLVCKHPDLLARICKLAERKKLALICFPRICFPLLIYCDQEPLQLLNVTEDYFLGVHVRLYQLDIQDLFHSKITSLFPQKSHECLWNTKLLFDLSYKFINGSFAFSCGQIYILCFLLLSLVFKHFGITKH